MAAVDTQVLLARVVAIDVEAMTYKLEFPDGAVNEYTAMVRENLEAASVGDMVAIEVTEYFLISIFSGMLRLFLSVV